MFAIQALRDHCAPIVTAAWRWLSNVVHVPFAACILVLAIAFSVPVAESRANDPVVAVMHVNIDREWPSQHPEDGESWSTAYRFLQDGLQKAEDLLADPNLEIDVVEIWVAEGTYRPDQSKNVDPLTANPYCAPFGNCSRTASFNLLNNVGIFGGFKGTEVERSERRPLENLTLLSGALKCEDPIGSPCAPAGQNQDNSRRIVVSQNNNATARLDGFHIAEARYEINNLDGAVHMEGSSAVISNCVIRDNIGFHSGSVHISGGSPQLINCVVRDNEGTSFSGCGGVRPSGGSDPVLVNCLIHDNSGLLSGGVATLGSGGVTLINCTIVDNVGYGVNIGSSGGATIVNSILWGNVASGTNVEQWQLNAGGHPDVCVALHRDRGTRSLGRTDDDRRQSDICQCVGR